MVSESSICQTNLRTLKQCQKIPFVRQIFAIPDVILNIKKGNLHYAVMITVLNINSQHLGLLHSCPVTSNIVKEGIT